MLLWGTSPESILKLWLVRCYLSCNPIDSNRFQAHLCCKISVRCTKTNMSYSNGSVKKFYSNNFYSKPYNSGNLFAKKEFLDQISETTKLFDLKKRPLPGPIQKTDIDIKNAFKTINSHIITCQYSFHIRVCLIWVGAATKT